MALINKLEYNKKYHKLNKREVAPRKQVSVNVTTMDSHPSYVKSSIKSIIKIWKPNKSCKRVE